MAYIKPFFCIRPNKIYASSVAALPYDVYSHQEAYEIVKQNPLSFLRIDRPETNFSPDTDPYSDTVYEKAAALLHEDISRGIYLQEKEPCLYLYELIQNGHSQTGIVGCASVADYENEVIRKHELTRTQKEEDRVKHITYCKAHTGPIFLAYRTNENLRNIISVQKKQTPIYRFTCEDKVTHIVYRISDKNVIQTIQAIFSEISRVYIADGHHRAAAAVRTAQTYSKMPPSLHSTKEYNYFLAVFFPEEELHIFDYNRVVKDLNGLTAETFLEKLKKNFQITPLKRAEHPDKKGTFCMFLEDNWYACTINPNLIPNTPVESLDVSLLQKHVLTPILNIDDPKTDTRIDFVGGIRGLEELERRCHLDCKLAFAMYPTSMQELFAVADQNLCMPPKSSWFEPKLRSGLFIHSF